MSKYMSKYLYIAKDSKIGDGEQDVVHALYQGSYNAFTERKVLSSVFFVGIGDPLFFPMNRENSIWGKLTKHMSRSREKSVSYSTRGLTPSSLDVVCILSHVRRGRFVRVLPIRLAILFRGTRIYP